MRLIYLALIRSHLEYASCLYSGVAVTHLEKLDVIEKKAAHLILGLPRGAHAAPLLKELQLDSLHIRRESRVHKIIEAIISGNCHPDLRTLFRFQPDNSIEVD